MKSTARLCAVPLVAFLCLASFIWDAALARAMRDELHMNDFGKFYYSARAFLDGRDMYAPSPATDLKLDKAVGLQFLNMNPPHFHLFVLPLALLTPAQAVGLWMGASLFALALSLLLIARELSVAWTPLRLLTALFVTLAFAGTQAFFGTGQLSMLLLLAMTVCWLDARRERWDRAAVLMGICMSVKPFLLLFVPYLLGTRRFRAILLALGAAAACFAVGFLVFGVGAHQSWYRALGQSGDWAWTPMNASVLGFFRRSFQDTPYFASALNAPSIVRAWLLPAGAIGIVTLVAAVVDKTSSSTDRAFALLLVAAPLLSPLGWVYYLWLPAGPIAVLLLGRDADQRRLHSSLRALMAIALVALLWPLASLYVFQPHSWATLTFGSIYFWGAMALWTLLLIDARTASGLASPMNSRIRPQL